MPAKGKTPATKYSFFVFSGDELEVIESKRALITLLKEKDAEELEDMRIVRGKEFKLEMQERVIRKPSLVKLD